MTSSKLASLLTLFLSTLELASSKFYRVTISEINCVGQEIIICSENNTSETKVRNDKGGGAKEANKSAGKENSGKSGKEERSKSTRSGEKDGGRSSAVCAVRWQGSRR